MKRVKEKEIYISRLKINYEWGRYADLHQENVEKDKGFALTCFIYENRRLFSLLHNNGLIVVVMRACELLVFDGDTWDKNLSYLMSYFIYGYFGIIYQWIKYGFDETPEQVAKHIADAVAAAGRGLENK